MLVASLPKYPQSFFQSAQYPKFSYFRVYRTGESIEFSVDMKLSSDIPSSSSEFLWGSSCDILNPQNCHSDFQCGTGKRAAGQVALPLIRIFNNINKIKIFNNNNNKIVCSSHEAKMKSAQSMGSHKGQSWEENQNSDLLFVYLLFGRRFHQNTWKFGILWTKAQMVWFFDYLFFFLP